MTALGRSSVGPGAGWEGSRAPLEPNAVAVSSRRPGGGPETRREAALTTKARRQLVGGRGEQARMRIWPPGYPLEWGPTMTGGVEVQEVLCGNQLSMFSKRCQKSTKKVSVWISKEPQNSGCNNCDCWAISFKIVSTIQTSICCLSPMATPVNPPKSKPRIPDGSRNCPQNKAWGVLGGGKGSAVRSGRVWPGVGPTGCVARATAGLARGAARGGGGSPRAALPAGDIGDGRRSGRGRVLSEGEGGGRRWHPSPCAKARLKIAFL